METNRITMEYNFENGTRLPLMTDLVHKIKRSDKLKLVEYEPSPSLIADSDVILNYFCNREMKFGTKVCCG